MKQFTIAVDGTVDTKASTGTSEKLYGTYDSATFQVHFSETEPSKAAQITALKDQFDKATVGKAPQRVKQRSKNVVGFSLVDEPDSAKADAARQAAFDEMKNEALKINKSLKANPGGAQQQTPPPAGNGQQQTPPPKGGTQQTPPTGGGQQQTPPPKGGQQQAPPAGGGQQKPAFDKTKDAFGRPLKQAYPGLFWAGMTAAEEEAACDQYWAMVRHVDKDIFHKT